MPRQHSEATRLRAQQLRAAGKSQAEVGALLGVHPRTIGAWERPADLDLDVAGLPTRLRIERRALRDRLVLVRGPRCLAVLGLRRGGAWDLSPAGQAHANSLRAVLPVLLARSARASAAEPFAEAETSVPARPCARRPPAA